MILISSRLCLFTTGIYNDVTKAFAVNMADSGKNIESTQNKVCGVCGDKALGYNFSAVTCESCKAFFRRNALKNKEFKCPFQDNCKVDAVTRRFCQKCRLKKCFEIGMKKEWIMSDEEKKAKMAKIEENRQKRQQEVQVSNLDYKFELERNTNSLSPPSQIIAHVSDPCEKLSKRNGSSTIPDSYVSHKISVNSVLLLEDQSSKSPVLDVRDNGKVHSSTWEIATSDDYICSTGNNLFFDSMPLQSRELTEIEKGKLNELVSANKAMTEPVHEDEKAMEKVDPCLIDVINMTDYAIRKIIRMSKKIAGFKTLCQEDQIALLKGGCTEMMILRSVMTFDPEKDCWQVPKLMYIKIDVLKEAKGNIYEEHKRFIHSFDPDWRSDEAIMLILGAITLFTPERPNVIHKEVIKAEQEAYFYLLRRYLESIYSGCEARSTYLKLVQRIGELHVLNEDHLRVFLNVNPKDVEPLLIEIFDLKH